MSNDFNNQEYNEFFNKVMEILEGGWEYLYVHELAEYWNMKAGLSVEERIDGIIWDATFNAGFVGFGTGMAGFPGLALGIPANLAVQFRMIGAVALVSGHDLGDIKTKILALSAISLQGPKVVAANYLTVHAVRAGEKYLEQVLIEVAMKVAARLSTEVPKKAITRWVPVFSGFVAGVVDGVFTNGVGECAKSLYLAQELKEMAPRAS